MRVIIFVIELWTCQFLSATNVQEKRNKVTKNLDNDGSLYHPFLQPSRGNSKSSEKSLTGSSSVKIKYKGDNASSEKIAESSENPKLLRSKSTHPYVGRDRHLSNESTAPAISRLISRPLADRNILKDSISKKNSTNECDKPLLNRSTTTYSGGERSLRNNLHGGPSLLRHHSREEKNSPREKLKHQKSTLQRVSSIQLKQETLKRSISSLSKQLKSTMGISKKDNAEEVPRGINVFLYCYAEHIEKTTELRKSIKQSLDNERQEMLCYASTRNPYYDNWNRYESIMFTKIKPNCEYKQLANEFFAQELKLGNIQDRISKLERNLDSLCEEISVKYVKQSGYIINPFTFNNKGRKKGKHSYPMYVPKVKVTCEGTKSEALQIGSCAEHWQPENQNIDVYIRNYKEKNAVYFLGIRKFPETSENEENYDYERVIVDFIKTEKDKFIFSKGC